MDAPIGYMASLQNYLDRLKEDQQNELTFEEFWAPENTSEVHHFIGKDIINFHALFWPAVLDGAGFRKPTRIHTHGFITVDGRKMSKSRGTSIDAATYLDFLEPEYLRYYYATKLNGTIDDADINFDDFVQRVNSDLVGKVVNIASRCAGFITKQFDCNLRRNRAARRPVLEHLAVLRQIKKVMLGLPQLRCRAGDQGTRVQEFRCIVGGTTHLTVVTILIIRAAARAFAFDEAVCQKHVPLGVEQLFHLGREDQTALV